MKKTFNIFGIIALTAIIGFFLAACQNGSGSEGPQKFIKIIGIPISYNGKYGALMLSQPKSSYYTVYSMKDMNMEIETTEDEETIYSFTFPMLNWKNDSRPWGGNGSYKITIFIYDSFDAMVINEQNYIYAGVIPEEIKITEITTEIEWSLFTKKNNLSIKFIK